MQLILLSEPVWIKICWKIDEISRKVLIAGVIGYDSIRKHLAVCVMNTRGIREKDHPYGCVHRYKGAEEIILVGEYYER